MVRQERHYYVKGVRGEQYVMKAWTFSHLQKCLNEIERDTRKEDKRHGRKYSNFFKLYPDRALTQDEIAEGNFDVLTSFCN